MIHKKSLTNICIGRKKVISLQAQKRGGILRGVTLSQDGDIDAVRFVIIAHVFR